MPTSNMPHSIPLSDICIISKADLQTLIKSVEDLNDSASNDGCEAPWFVGDETHLQALAGRLSALKSLQSLDKALRLVNGDLEKRSEPILVVVPAEIQDADVSALMDKAIAQTANEQAAGSEAAHIEVLERHLGQHGIAVATGIENVQCLPWDAEADQIGDEADASAEKHNQESSRDR